METPDDPLEENRRLRRTMRDLIALSTLPAVWTGMAPDGIARSLADMLFNTLSLDLVYVRLAGVTGEGEVEVVRTKPRSTADIDAVRAAVVPLLGSDRGEPPSTIPDPFGREVLHVAVTRFGVGDDHGVLVTGSSNPDFPTERDRLLLGVGANQTAIVVQRSRAEQQVRKSEVRFNRFMESLPGLAWIKDSDGRYVYANDASERAFGVRRDELYGKTDDEVFPAATAAQFRENDRRALASASGIQTVETLEDTDGKVRDSLVSKFIIPDPPARAALIGGVAFDITERKRTENQLRESEERFRAIFTQTLAGIAETDLTGRFVQVNQRYCEVVGRSEDELVGLRMQDITHPDDLPHNLSLFEQAVTHGTPFTIEKRYVRPDGSFVWVNNSVSLIRDERGQPKHVVAASLDITDRKRAEETLRDSEAHFRSMADNAPTMLWVTDPTGCCTYLSSRWYEFTGRPSGRDVGFGWLEAVHPDDVAAARDVFLKANEQQIPFALDYRVRRHDGEYRWAVDAGLPRFDGGVYKGYVGCVFDVHERKLAEQRLQEADRRKDEFLATLAHELRNPLAPIRNGLQVMRLAAGHAETVEQVRSMMERQLEQMVRLVDDLLDVSRISRNKLELKKERVPLAAVLNSAVETSRPLIEQPGHALTVTLPPESILLDADLTRLAQVFSNLLNNAAKYTEPGGRIGLTAELASRERERPEVAVSVRDTGIGIPADKLPTVFEMFSQVEGSLSRSQGGLGIGLCLVKRLTEMHGGSIEARSAGPGRGSEFVVRLPVVPDQRHASKSDDADRTTPTSRLRILVVDDNRDAAASLEMLLKLMGNEVRTAHDGEEGVAAAGEFRPHVVLLDIGLPKMNGYETCRQIRQQSWGRPMLLIALTGWGQDDDKRRSAEAGFDRHLVKPVAPPSLMKLLAELPLVKS